MRILHIIPNLVKGGAQRIAIDICIELNQRQGVEVCLVYFEGENEFSFLTHAIDVQRIKIQFELSFRKKNQLNLDEYEQLVDAFQPDIIHSHLYRAELISRENPRENIQYFTHCHDNIKQLYRHKMNALFTKRNLIDSLERRRLLKRYRACNNTFIAIASDGINYLKNNLPETFASSIVLLHNAINVEAFKADRKDFNSNHHLINVGNFISKKNQAFLIDVVSGMRDKGIYVPLTLLGDGITKRETEGKVKKQGLSDQIIFKGKTDDVKSELLHSTIYVHSALYEPFGLVLVEAMASGLPVVSLDGVGNRDLIRDGENGFLVDQGDQARFVQCIINLMSDSQLYQKFQKAGYQTAKQYDIHPYVDRLLDLYKLKK
jgi:glycosyltransferase involved in cell wall biosynthesis